ncbi:DNA-binding response regulator [Roseivirga sp.]|uniref:helix-turn-helix transcriptional regulator n=1 Tax=Roseivirga sp. TaxID=1964215 RepID=UPI003B8D2300
MKKAAIYDPQFLSSTGIKIILENYGEINEVVVFNTDRNLADQVQRHQPELLILEYLGDFILQDTVTRQIKESYPDLRILIVSEDDDAVSINKHLKAGVDGFLTKNCSVEEINTALDVIHKGGSFFCQKVTNLVNNLELGVDSELSEREMQIIKSIGRGLPSSEIANNLGISIHTVNSHRKNILKKLGLKSPTELIIYAVDRGWLKPKKTGL